MDWTSEFFNSPGPHCALPPEADRAGGNDEREGDVGDSMIDAPHMAQEIWVLWFPGIDEGVSSSMRVIVDIGSIDSCPL